MSHEVIYGPAAAGKTYKARKRIADDHANGDEIWVIDPTRMEQPRWADSDSGAEYAGSLDEARQLLARAVERAEARLASIHPSHERYQGPPISLTIESAALVLADATCRAHTEHLFKLARKARINIRLIQPALTLEAFGGSTAIRDTVFEVSGHTSVYALVRAGELEAFWERHVSRPGELFPGATLTQVHQTPVGWEAVVVL